MITFCTFAVLQAEARWKQGVDRSTDSLISSLKSCRRLATDQWKSHILFHASLETLYEIFLTIIYTCHLVFEWYRT